jgi:acylphosphatase
MERAVIIIKGRVQKAGYRDFIDETAFNLDLTGRVQNLKDGSVEVVCEGSKDKIRELVKKIEIKQYPIKVESIDVKYSKAKGEYKSFEIVREEDLTTAVYDRMDTAARYMREMNQDLGSKIDTAAGYTREMNQDLGGRMENLGGKIDNLGGKMDTFGGKIDNLGGKMDNFGGKIDKGFSEVNNSLTKVNDSVSGLDHNISNNFDHLDKKYDKISDRMERMDKTLEKLADAILQLARK